MGEPSSPTRLTGGTTRGLATVTGGLVGRERGSLAPAVPPGRSSLQLSQIVAASIMSAIATGGLVGVGLNVSTRPRGHRRGGHASQRLRSRNVDSSLALVIV